MNPETNNIQDTFKPNQFKIFQQKYLNNNYIMVVVIIVIILITIIFSIITINFKSTENGNVVASPTTQLNQSVSPSLSTTVPPSGSLTPTDPPEVKQIKTQIDPQIQKVIAPGVSYNYTFVKTYGESWAIANIYNQTVGGALVILQKVNGNWTIVLGPGSSFSPQQLSTINAPQELINDVESGQTTISPSPSGE